MSTRNGRSWTGKLTLVAAFVPSAVAFAETYDYVGVSNMGADIVVSGTFQGSDIDDDGALEWPNVPLEVSHFDGNATLFTGGGKVNFNWGLFEVNDLTFHELGGSGLLSMDAEEHSADLINGNEVHVDSTFAVVNSGNINSNRFAADLELRVATDTHRGIGSGPLMISEKLITPGSKFQYVIEFGNGGTPHDGGTLLGSFTIDDVDDPDDLRERRIEINSSDATFYDSRGNASRWEFESGLSSPPTAGGTAGGVSVHYQCGSPNIICWGSVDDFIDLWTGMNGANDHTQAAALTSMEVMIDTATVHLPIESAYVSLASVVPQLSADFNLDGVVDGEDFLTWQASHGTTAGATHQDGDADGDGDVDGEDFLQWQLEFQGGGPTGGAAGVPEPAAMTLLATFAMALASRRSR